MTLTDTRYFSLATWYWILLQEILHDVTGISGQKTGLNRTCHPAEVCPCCQWSNVSSVCRCLEFQSTGNRQS